jgi:hypothetical protein
VKTEGYAYRLNDEMGAEILSYHWHPLDQGVIYPHLHLKRGAQIGRAELQKCHMPTGRVAIESVVLFLIETFGVKPLREDWSGVLRTNFDLFNRHRTW